MMIWPVTGADARVPSPNAYELDQGLQDVGVPMKLMISGVA